MWNQRYGEPGYAYGTAPNDFIAEAHRHLPPGGQVVCVGAGEGRNAVFLAEQGFQVTAVDLSDVGLAKTAALAAERGVTVHTVQADLATWQPGEGVWDGIVSVFCHLPPPVRVALHGRLAAALKPGGALLMEAYSPAQLAHGTGGPPARPMLYVLTEIQAELGDLDWVVAQELEREIHEGPHHNGVSAVMQLVGRRAG